MSKKTEWFRADLIKPVHEGLYECFVFYPDGRNSFHAYVWNGCEWRTRDGYAVPFGVHGDKWRGLAAPSGTEPSDVSQRRG